VDKFPVIKDQSKEYCLGKGHIAFFKARRTLLSRQARLFHQGQRTLNFFLFFKQSL
jgi:hypothetical protein